MEIADCLRKVVLDKWQRSLDSVGNVTLKERGVMSVQVSGLSPDSVVIRPKKMALSGLENGPWEKSCDYLIFSPNGDTVRVLFVELKKTLNDKEIEGFEQLRRSLPRLEYLWSLCRIHCGDGPDRIEVRYALVAEKVSPRFDKQSVRSDGSLQTKLHKEIKVGRHIVSRHKRFSRLWGN